MVFTQECWRGVQEQESRSMPLDWKNSNIMPVFMKDSRYDPLNYRLIGLTSVVCKVLEKLFRNKIIRDLEGKNCLAHQQHALSFRQILPDSTDRVSELCWGSNGSCRMCRCSVSRLFKGVWHCMTLITAPKAPGYWHWWKSTELDPGRPHKISSKVYGQRHLFWVVQGM